MDIACVSVCVERQIFFFFVSYQLSMCLAGFMCLCITFYEHFIADQTTYPFSLWIAR